MSAPVTVAEATSKKYATAFISFGLIILTAIAGITHWDKAAIVQIVTLAVGAVVTYWVPLTPGKYQGWWKTGASAVLAAVAAITPFFISGHYNAQSIVLTVIAVFQVLGTHVGVTIRSEGASAGK